MSDPGPIVIIGASLAGLTAADTLRSVGYGGAIIVVDPSSDIPHDRPPLSKQVLSGEWEPDRAVLRIAERIGELELDLRLGTAVTAVDADRNVTLSDGSTVAAAGIVIASGASPRHLGEEPPGTHVLRTLDDCEALRADLTGGTPSVAVIGAGFIGAEVAATCRGLDLPVTMIEAGPVPLGRVLPGEIGEFVADLHRSHGVDVRLGVGVDGLDTGVDGRVSGVRLADGSAVDAQVVVVGIGVVPNVAFLEGSGLDGSGLEGAGIDISNGVLCDASLLAAPGIVAAGDIARWPNPRYDGELMRVEQWENAIESGEHAARRLLAEVAPDDVEATTDSFASIPWFWSDQYDRKIQMAGRPSAGDEPVVVEGAIADQRFVVLFRRGDRCTGVLGVNRPRHVMQARMAMRDSLDWAAVEARFS